MTKNSEYRCRLNLVMLPEERAMLQALAKASESNESEVLRSMVRDAYAEQFRKRKPGPPKPKYNARPQKPAR